MYLTSVLVNLECLFVINFTFFCNLNLGSQSYLILPALLHAGTPWPLPSRWQWLPDVPGAQGIAGYSDTQRPWRRKDTWDKMGKQGVWFISSSFFFVTKDWHFDTMDKHNTELQSNQTSRDCSGPWYDCPSVEISNQMLNLLLLKQACEPFLWFKPFGGWWFRSIGEEYH